MEPNSREPWDAFVQQHGGSFLQSWTWGEFQAAVGNPVTRVGSPGAGWVAQWVHQRVHFGSQLACYHGPVPADPSTVRSAAAAVRTAPANFLHLELPYAEASRQTGVPPEGWIPAGSRQAPATRVVDLSPPLEEIRDGLHPKTRYNIGVAERRGVEIRVHRDASAVEAFLALLPKTSGRHGIAAHAPGYYRTMAEHLLPQGMLVVFLAERAGRPIAGHLVLRYGTRATYLHGASEYTERSAMAPHLLQWHQLRWAKEQGCTVYDLWGVAPPNAPANHPFAGITRFKEGFGGALAVSGGAFDLPRTRLWYKLYRAAKRVRG